jgi:hypothetical protein
MPKTPSLSGRELRSRLAQFSFISKIVFLKNSFKGSFLSGVLKILLGKTAHR